MIELLYTERTFHCQIPCLYPLSRLRMKATTRSISHFEVNVIGAANYVLYPKDFVFLVKIISRKWSCRLSPLLCLLNKALLRTWCSPSKPVQRTKFLTQNEKTSKIYIQRAEKVLISCSNKVQAQFQSNLCRSKVHDMPNNLNLDWLNLSKISNPTFFIIANVLFMSNNPIMLNSYSLGAF